MPRVLIVDDEQSVRTSLSLLLRASGWDVLEAAGGVEALDRLAGEEVELLVTDIGMPEMDGWTLAANVRTACPAIAVIYMTGWTGVSERPVPGGKMIDKPFGAAQLLDLADRLTHNQRAA